MDETAIMAALAVNVRQARQRHGWSLDALASRAGLSKGVLVAVENGRTNPNLGTLVRISDSLGLTITDLLGAPRVDAPHLTAPDQQPVMWRGALGGTGRLVTGTGGVELWLWRLSPGEERRSEAHGTGTVEVLYGLRGRLRVTVGATEVEVPPGHSLRFAGDVEHAYANRGRHPVEYIGVVLVPSG
jgi:transcriptional regulator with XRE-family HTH domain